MTDRPSHAADVWHQGRVAGPRGPRPPPARHRSRRGSRRWLAVTGYGGLALVCLCLAAVAFLLVAPPLDAVRDRLIERVSARTGRTLTISGPASLSLFPRPAVSFSDVAMLAREDMPGAPIATVPSIEIEVSLWSLLLRRPQVGRLTLHRPTIDLAVDAEGRRNWESAGARRPAPTATVETSGRRPPLPAEPVGSGRPAATAQRPGGGSVRVIDATLRYRDERSGARHEIGPLNLALAADDLERPLEVSGTLAARGGQLGFSATALPLRAILAGRPVQLSLKIAGAPIEAAYEGKLTLDRGSAVDGKLRIHARSARALADWLGTAWLAGSASDALSLSAHITLAGSQVTLSQMEASLGDVALAGSLAVDIKERPKVSGKLQISELDFGRLFAGRSKGAGAVAAPPPASGSAVPVETEKRANGKGWSEEAIDPQILALADANLALSVGRLVYRDVKTGPSTLSVAIVGGSAKVVIEDIELYGGRGQGKLMFDGTGAALAVGANLKLAGVSIRPLLGDAAGVGWLDGRGTVALALSGRGVSERQIVETLDGKVDVAVAEGALTGIDIGKLLRDLQRGRLASLAPAPEDRTPFSELSGSFDIAKGTATSRDLKLDSAHLRLKGEGAIELGPRRIDCTLQAKIAGGPPAEGAAVRIGTLELPIGIKGPLAAPAFTIMGQEALGGALKQIGKNLKSREVQDAIKGLLRGDGDKRTNPREVIEKLLKKQ